MSVDFGLDVDFAFLQAEKRKRAQKDFQIQDLLAFGFPVLLPSIFQE